MKCDKAGQIVLDDRCGYYGFYMDEESEMME